MGDEVTISFFLLWFASFSPLSIKDTHYITFKENLSHEHLLGNKMVSGISCLSVTVPFPLTHHYDQVNHRRLLKAESPKRGV